MNYCRASEMVCSCRLEVANEFAMLDEQSKRGFADHHHYQFTDEKTLKIGSK